MIEVGTQALRTMGYGYIFYRIGMVMIQGLNGAGDTKTPTIIHFVCFWLFQIPLAYFLFRADMLDIKGIFWAIPIAETLIAIVVYLIFRQGKWKKVKV